DQTNGDLPAGQRRLGEVSSDVQGLELTESDLVGALQPLLAERPLRALRRPTQDARLAGALAGEVRQGAQAVLVRRRLGDRERVLVSGLRGIAESEPDLGAVGLQCRDCAVQVARRLRRGAGAV